MRHTVALRTLLVSDLHYDLRKLDWVLSQAGTVDLLVVAGDLLDLASAVPLDAQIVVALEYLSRFAERTTTVTCSGETLVARGRLVRSGRTLSVAAADVYAVRGGIETLCATALATIRNFEITRP